MNFVAFLLINLLLLVIIPEIPIGIQLIWLGILLGLAMWKSDKYIKDLI
jgi:hypothetical protein